MLLRVHCSVTRGDTALAPVAEPTWDERKKLPPYLATFSVASLYCMSSKPRPLALHLFSLADEMTVGKVYAALMIFDFYKQNKTTRDQTHPAPGGLSQVQLWETYRCSEFNG